MEPLQCFVCVVIKALTCAVVSAGLNFQHTSPTDVKPPLCAECNSLPYHLGCHRYCCFHSGTIVCTVQCFFFFYFGLDIYTCGHWLSDTQSVSLTTGLHSRLSAVTEGDTMGVVRSWLENRSTMTGELSLASFEMRELEEQDVGSSQSESEDASDEIEG